MKRFLAAMVMILSLLFLTPVVHAQIDVVPEVLSSKCSSDGCVMIWRVTVQNESNDPIKGKLTLVVRDVNKNVISDFNMGVISLKGHEFRILQGTILFENSERTKNIKFLTATIELLQSIQLNTKPKPILRF
jgi:hypothetical protein